MDLAWEVLRSNRKAVSTKTKIWNSTKPGRDGTNSIKWPQIWVWNCSEPRLWPEKKALCSPVPLLYPMTPSLSRSPSALLLHEICAPHHCFIPKSFRQHCHVMRTGKLSQLSLDLTISLDLKYHLNSDALFHAENSLEMLMRLRKRENASYGMYCVLKNRPMNCSFSFSPHTVLCAHSHIPGFPWIISFIHACKTQSY